MEAASQPAALVTRSWVGRVRVVGSADVIDAFVAWQKTVRFDGSTLHRDSNEAAPSGAASVLTAGASRPLGWVLAEAESGHRVASDEPSYAWVQPYEVPDR